MSLNSLIVFVYNCGKLLEFTYFTGRMYHNWLVCNPSRILITFFKFNYGSFCKIKVIMLLWLNVQTEVGDNNRPAHNIVNYLVSFLFFISNVPSLNPA
jgi:hypothetical protein